MNRGGPNTMARSAAGFARPAPAHRRLPHIAALAVAAGTGGAGPAAGQASFTGLDLRWSPRGIEPDVTGISDDGSVVAGWHDCESPGVWCSDAFRWTSTGGLESIGEPISQANAVSADGSTVVGAFQGIAFRWTSAGGMETLGKLAGFDWSVANAASADGSVVVGASTLTSGDARAFRWSGEMEDLGTLGGSSSAVDVSADGSVVVGRSGSGGSRRAFRWTAQGGMAPLELPAGAAWGEALAVSADGSTVIGAYGYGPPTDRGLFRWTRERGAVALTPILDPVLHILSVSADTSMFVGAYVSYAVIWREGWSNWVDLNELLPSLGIDLTNWELYSATVLSADGRAIAGLGAHGDRLDGWVATIPDLGCYADCDGSGSLDLFDFLCFQNLFSAGEPAADCDGDGELTFLDFLCFQNAFAAGCP